MTAPGTPIYYVPETVVAALVRQTDITEAVRGAFMAEIAGHSRNFPVIRETAVQATAVFGFKSGLDLASKLFGIKTGGLWPNNRERGLASHQSTITLFRLDTGEPIAFIGAAHLTALRTAAAAALSIRACARRDARVLGIVGAGGQAPWQVRAALRERAFDLVLVNDRDLGLARQLAAAITAEGTVAESTDVAALSALADVIITVTPSREPILRDCDIRPGTHLACMGADTVGKQEVETALVERATKFTDLPAQAALIGECQHAVGEGAVAIEDITPLGFVLAGTVSGRSSGDEVTLFDGTGMAVQDLAAGVTALRIARDAGQAVALPY